MDVTEMIAGELVELAAHLNDEGILEMTARKTTGKKPAAYDNSWLGNTVLQARLQVIGDDDRWHTIGTCMDTPNSIKEAVKAFKGQSVWVYNGIGRSYYGLVK